MPARARRSVGQVFETDFGRVAVTICSDVEFPEIARAAARLGPEVKPLG